MDIDAIKEEIKAKEQEISRLKSYIRSARQEIAEDLCPFKVGDRVINRFGGEEEIASIHYRDYGIGYCFKVYKIKKNGEPYQCSCEVYNLDKYSAKADKTGE